MFIFSYLGQTLPTKFLFWSSALVVNMKISSFILFRVSRHGVNFHLIIFQLSYLYTPSYLDGEQNYFPYHISWILEEKTRITITNFTTSTDTVNVVFFSFIELEVWNASRTFLSICVFNQRASMWCLMTEGPFIMAKDKRYYHSPFILFYEREPI